MPLRVVSARGEAEERAARIVAELRGGRRVIGDGPWKVTYAAADVTEAFRLFEAESG